MTEGGSLPMNTSHRSHVSQHLGVDSGLLLLPLKLFPLPTMMSGKSPLNGRQGRRIAWFKSVEDTVMEPSGPTSPSAPYTGSFIVYPLDTGRFVLPLTSLNGWCDTR